MYFSALCLFNCSLLSDMQGRGLQVSCREQRGILLLQTEVSERKAPQAPVTAVKAGAAVCDACDRYRQVDSPRVLNPL